MSADCVTVAGGPVDCTATDNRGVTSEALHRILQDLGARDQDITTMALQSVRGNTSDLMSLGIQNDLHRRRQLVNGKPSVICPEIGSAESVRVLAEAFPELTVQPGNDRDGLGHPVARAARRLDHYLIFHEALKTDSDAILGVDHTGRPYDVVVKDVGGDLRHHLVGGAKSVHVCSPVLSPQDVARQDNVQLQLENELPVLLKRPRTHEMAVRVANNDPKYCCRKPAQLCNVRAPNVVFMHSSYDIALCDVATILERSGANRAFAVLHVHPLIFTSATTGMLPNIGCVFRKFLDEDGHHKISFSFAGDPQLSYVHRWDTYVALISNSHILSHDRTQLFVVQTVRFSKLCVAHIRITRARDSLCASKVQWNLPYMDHRDHVFLRAYEYDTIESTVTGRLRPYILFVDKRLFENLLGYASALGTGKFIVQNVLIAANSFNARTVIGGTAYTNTEKLASRDLHILAVAVYMLVYVMNWENSRLLEHLRNDEDTVRKLASSSLFTQVKHVLSKKVEQLLHDSVPLITDATNKLRSQFEDNWMQYLQRENQIIVDYLPQTVTFSDVVPEFISLEKHTIAAYARVPNVDQLPPPSVAHGFVSSAISDRVFTFEKRRCNHTLYERQVPGDGDCFFHSVIAILDLVETPAQIRKRLSSSAWLNTVETETRKMIVDRLMSRGRNGWVNVEIVKLFTREYRVSVCIHGNARDCDVHNPSADVCCHLRLVGSHFNPLLESEYVPRPDIYARVEQVDSPLCMSYNYNLAIQQCDVTGPPRKLRNSNARLQSTGTRKDCREASLAYHPMSSVDFYGYSSGYATLLHSALHGDTTMSQRMENPLRVLDISATNASSSQYYCDGFSHDVTAIVERHPQSCNGNIKSHSMDDYLHDRVHFSGEFDLVSVNPPYNDKLSHIDVERYAAWFSDMTASPTALPDTPRALRELRVGGDCVFAVPLVSDNKITASAATMLSHFRRSYAVYSRAVPPHNPWVVFVCCGLLQSPRDVDVMQFQHVMARIWLSTSSEIALAASSIKSFANNPKRPPVLSAYDYRLVASAMRSRLRVCAGGAIVSTAAPSWVPVFDRAFLRQLQLADSVLTSPAAFRVALRKYCEHVSDVLITQLCRVLQIPRDFGNDCITQFCENALRTVAKGCDFYAAFVRALHVNVCERGDRIVMFALRADDVIAGTRLTSAHVPQMLVARYDNSLSMTPKRVETDVVEPMMQLALQTAIEEREQVDVRQRLCDVVSAARDAGAQPKRASAPPHQEPEKTAVSVFPPVTGGTGSLYPEHDQADFQQRCVDEFDNYNKAAVKVVMDEAYRHLGRVYTVDWDSAHVVNNMVANALCGVKSPTLYVASRRLIGPSVFNSSTGKFTHRYGFTWTGDNPTKIHLLATHTLTEVPRNFYTYESLKIFTEFDFALLSSIHTFSRVDLDNVGLIQAAAGCGKTTSIVRTLKQHATNRALKFMVLTSTTEGAKDVAERVLRDCGDDGQRLSKCVKTIDAYCMHLRTRCDAMLIDEALMQMPGKILRALHWAQCREARLYGDRLQIPFVNRMADHVVYFSESSRVFKLADIMDLSFRSPADVALVLTNHYLALNSRDGYNVGMRSASTALTPSMHRKQITSVSEIPSLPEVQYLTFTQADKETVAREKNVKVSTVHEFQGKEANNVCLIRLTRDTGDNIFSKVNHCVTAITRHRKTLTYYTCGDCDDLVSSWIAHAHRADRSQLARVHVVTERLPGTV